MVLRHVFVALVWPGGLCRRAGLALLMVCLSLVRATARQVKLTTIFWRIAICFWRFAWFWTLRFSCRPFRSSETGVTGGWTHVSEDLGSHFLCDGEAVDTLEDLVTNFYWFVESFNFLIFVVFPVLPRPECQLAGLASPWDSALTCLSDGESGVTLVGFLASPFAESRDSYDFGFALIWAAARLVKFSPMFSGLFYE